MIITVQKLFKFTFLTRLGWPMDYVKGRWFSNIARTILWARGIYRGTFNEWTREHNARRREQIKNGQLDCENATFKGPMAGAGK